MNIRIAILLLLLANSVYPAELILKSGDVFLCDVIMEEKNSVRVKWKDGYCSGRIPYRPRAKRLPMDYDPTFYGIKPLCRR